MAHHDSNGIRPGGKDPSWLGCPIGVGDRSAVAWWRAVSRSWGSADGTAEELYGGGGGGRGATPVEGHSEYTDLIMGSRWRQTNGDTRTTIYEEFQSGEHKAQKKHMAECPESPCKKAPGCIHNAKKDTCEGVSAHRREKMCEHETDGGEGYINSML